MLLFIGAMPSASIEVWQVDPHDLAATRLGAASGLLSPSFLCLHPTLARLYAVERNWSDTDPSTGALTTFAIDRSNGTLRQIDRCRSGGAFTAHVSVSADGAFLTTANPRGPTIALFHLDEAGLPGAGPDVVTYRGRGAKPRQAEPWPHSAFFDAAGRHVLACDLGLDRIFIHRLDREAKALAPTEQGFAQVSSGAGARHLTLAGDGRTVYVANELDSTVAVFRFDPEQGHMWIVQTVLTVPTAHAERNQPAEILLSPDGRFLYVTNRGDDTLAVFAVDPDSGHLTLIDQIATFGISPRHATIDTAGKIMAICNQQSHEVRLFRLGADGLPQLAGFPIAVGNPTCARFF